MRNLGETNCSNRIYKKKGAVTGFKTMSGRYVTESNFFFFFENGRHRNLRFSRHDVAES